MKAISEEQLRILVAAADRRLSFFMPEYRYKIKGEDPPDRRERERLQKRGLLSRPSSGGQILTERGRLALETAPVTADGSNPVSGQTTLEQQGEVG